MAHEVAAPLLRFEHARFAESLHRLLDRDLAHVELVHDLPDRQEFFADAELPAAFFQVLRQLIRAAEPDIVFDHKGICVSLCLFSIQYIL